MIRIGKRGVGYMAAAIAMIVLTAGCSSTNGPDEWFGFGAQSGAKQEGVFFAGVERLAVRDAPGSRAKTVGTLSLHQKVVRSKLTDGYALVSAADGSVKGWVDNAKLLWKLPQEAPAEQTADETPTEEVTPPPESVTDSPSPEPPAEAPREQKPRSRSGASVFDPY